MDTGKPFSFLVMRKSPKFKYRQAMIKIELRFRTKLIWVRMSVVQKSSGVSSNDDRKFPLDSAFLT